jgi:hypothetical protein
VSGDWRTVPCESAQCGQARRCACCDGDGVELRSSLDPDRTIHLTAQEWAGLVAGITALDTSLGDPAPSGS